MENAIHLQRTALCITQHCTLKCKLCLAFTPYYENPRDLSFEEAKVVLKRYFEIVDSVRTFTVTGGEPLMNKDLYKIMELVYTYADKIESTIDFVTNATLNIPAPILDLFEKHAKVTKVILSDYGELSSKIGEISQALKDRGIMYRISNFHGEDLYFDGWIDFTNHDKKIFSIEERDAQGKRCVHRSGSYYVINDGELHSCSRSYWRMKQGIIPKTKGEFVDLLNETLTIDEKRKDLAQMRGMNSSTSCEHCVGLCNGVERHYPAEQL